MISETLLRALQERMRKLTGASSIYAVRNAELRAALERARLTEATEAIRETEGIRESERLMEEIKELRDHINALLRSRKIPPLFQASRKNWRNWKADGVRSITRSNNRGRIVTTLSKTPSKNSSPRSTNTDTSPTRR